MVTLQKLIQDDDGRLYKDKTTPVKAWPTGRLRTLLVQNPCINIGTPVEALAKNYPHSIPWNANAYVASDFNPDTQFFRDEKAFSVYAIQFYFVMVY